MKKRKPSGPRSGVERGAFETYRAKARIRTSTVTGAAELVLEAGDIVEYDGLHVRLPDGRLVSAPSLRGAITIGWLVKVTAN